MSSPEPIQIAEGVYHVQVGPNATNVGFVITGDGVVVIDSGPSPKAGEQVKAAIATVTTQPVAYVINTHFHSSHTFGNQAFGVPVIGHTLCRAQMQRALREEWHPDTVERWIAENPVAGADFEDFRVVVPGISFSGTGFLHIGGCVIHLIGLGNHTPDSIAVYLPEHRALFAGDNLFASRHPFLRHANASQWVETLRRMEGLKFDYAIPGHGHVMDRKDVYNLRVYFESLLKAPRHRKGLAHLERIAQV